MRRITTYEPPRIHTGSSRGPTHTLVAIAARSSTFRLFVPSLKPIRLRGVCFEPGLAVKPVCAQRISATP